MKTLDGNKIKRNITLIAVALFLSLVASINCDAQAIDTVKIVTVQSGKTVLKLTPSDVHYAVTYFNLDGDRLRVLKAFGNGRLSFIKNNDAADFIIAIMKTKKSK